MTVVVYLVFIVTSVLAGLVALLLLRRADPSDRKAFLAGALINLASLAAILYAEERRRR